MKPSAALIAATSELLDVCRDALAALNTTPRFKVPSNGISPARDTDSYTIAARLEKAIVKAGGRLYNEGK